MDSIYFEDYVSKMESIKDFFPVDSLYLKGMFHGMLLLTPILMYYYRQSYTTSMVSNSSTIDPTSLYVITCGRVYSKY